MTCRAIQEDSIPKLIVSIPCCFSQLNRELNRQETSFSNTNLELRPQKVLEERLSLLKKKSMKKEGYKKRQSGKPNRKNGKPTGPKNL